jgi:Ser/Thr protein kinase RdoA (MazF antagonist)
LLDEELRFQSLHRFPDVPRGPVHADLFRDNVLFEQERLSGVIDFYFAGVDCLLYDVAGVRERLVPRRPRARSAPRSGANDRAARCLSGAAAAERARA